jgi:tetratricopeptide (TPR) repeat protein
LFLAAALSGCAALFPQTVELAEGLPQGVPREVELKQVPFFPQLEYQCGPAALATALAAFGAKVTPDELVSQVYLPERKGSLQVEMLAAARRHGTVSYMLAPRFTDLLREIAAGNPVVVLIDQGLGPLEYWHSAVAVGYDYDYGQLVLRSGETERRLMPFPLFEFMWKKSGYWAMVALPPGRIPATAEETRWLAAIAALERTGEARGARTAYAGFLARWPDNVNAAIGLANTHYTLKELPQAEAVLRRAAERAPDSVVVLNNLAQTLSDLGRDEEALAFAERAVAAGGPFAAAARETREQILARLAKKTK